MQNSISTPGALQGGNQQRASNIYHVPCCVLPLQLSCTADCKTYAPGSNFACNLAAGQCCQKGLDCVSGTCKVPSSSSGGCKTYANGSNFPCNLAAGQCCQKGLDCVSGTCKVPSGRRRMLA